MLKNRKYLSFKVFNEYDLHTKVVEFIGRSYLEAILTPGLGELQGTSGKRISSYRKGCQKGQPDIITGDARVEEHQQIYAEVVISHPAKNKVCTNNEKPNMYKNPGNILKNQPRITNDLSSGIVESFIGLERKRNKIKKFFLTGIAESVKECQILSYLKQRNITPTYISIFQSRRKGAISAKVNIPSSACSVVQKEDFWPRFVSCKPWLSKEHARERTEMRIKVTQDGNYSTYV